MSSSARAIAVFSSGSGARPNLARSAFFCSLSCDRHARTTKASVNMDMSAAVDIRISKTGKGGGGTGMPNMLPARTSSAPIALPPRSTMELSTAPTVIDWPSGCIGPSMPSSKATRLSPCCSCRLLLMLSVSSHITSASVQFASDAVPAVSFTFKWLAWTAGAFFAGCGMMDSEK